MSQALARGYSHGVISFHNLDGLLDSFIFFVSQNYLNYLVFWHRLTAGLVSQALARGYLHGVTSFQNLDGLLDSFNLFVIKIAWLFGIV